MYIILILLIVLVMLIKMNKQKIENFYDRKSKNKQIINKHENNILKMVNEYYKSYIPIYIKTDIYDKVNKYLSSKFKNRLTIIDIEYAKITKYPGTTNYYLEIFILDNTTYTSNKFIIKYNVENGGIFKLDDIRIYNFKEDKSLNNENLHGINTNLVISRKNLTNPFVDNSLNSTIQNNNTSSLEYSNIDNNLVQDINKNILNKQISSYNSIILPNNIPDKSLYISMTPDFYNINVYPVEINNDIFSRTRGIPSFPRAISI